MPNLRIEFIPPRLLGDSPGLMKEAIAVATMPVTGTATPAGSWVVVPPSTGQLTAIITSDVPTYVGIDPAAPDPTVEPRMLIMPSLPRVLAISAGRKISAVSASPSGVFTAAILAGQSMSNVVDFGSYRLRRVDMPSAWTPATIRFDVSADGVNFGELVKASMLGGVATASSRMILDGGDGYFTVARFLRLVSVGLNDGVPVNQVADRVITLVAA